MLAIAGEYTNPFLGGHAVEEFDEQSGQRFGKRSDHDLGGGFRVQLPNAVDYDAEARRHCLPAVPEEGWSALMVDTSMVCSYCGGEPIRTVLQAGWAICKVCDDKLKGKTPPAAPDFSFAVAVVLRDGHLPTPLDFRDELLRLRRFDAERTRHIALAFGIEHVVFAVFGAPAEDDESPLLAVAIRVILDQYVSDVRLQFVSTDRFRDFVPEFDRRVRSPAGRSVRPASKRQSFLAMTQSTSTVSGVPFRMTSPSEKLERDT